MLVQAAVGVPPTHLASSVNLSTVCQHCLQGWDLPLFAHASAVETSLYRRAGSTVCKKKVCICFFLLQWWVVMVHNPTSR